MLLGGGRWALGSVAQWGESRWLGLVSQLLEYWSLEAGLGRLGLDVGAGSEDMNGAAVCSSLSMCMGYLGGG